MVALSSYWASVGIRVDEKDIKKVDDFLRKIETRLSKFSGTNKLRINPYIDEAKFRKHIQGVVNRLSKSTPLKISNIVVDPASLSKSIRATIGKATYKAPVTAVLSRSSLTTLRAQVAGALQGLPINIRVGNVSRGTGSRGGYTGEEAARRRASLTGRGDPPLMEQWMGRPDKSSLSAGNRRYYDAMVGKAFGGVGGKSLTGLAIQGGMGGLARAGSGSLMGRMAASAGMTLGGPLGGTMGLVASGIISLAGSAFKGIWSTLGKVITAPFSAISSAASMVTGAFYRIALAAAPLVLGFNYVDRQVREKTVQGVALETTAKQFGSTGVAERDWLMNMANNSGVEYNNIVSPFTSFISASAPAMGLEQSKGIFEALTQYGITHGANAFSMQNALKAFGQIIWR